MGLDVVELVALIEEQYDLTISDADARSLRSVGDLHRYIVAHAEPSPNAAATWSWLVDMIEAEFGVARARITPDAWIVRDLGIN